MNTRLQGFSRRKLLRGILAGAAVSVGLPWLEVFAGRRAQAACGDGFPKRLVLFLWGNGNRPAQWTPTGSGSDWSLSAELAALEAFKQKITVVSGLSVKVDNISPHWSSATGLLTGQPIIGDDNSWTVAAPTIDQVVAQAIGGETIYRSLQIGVDSAGCFSYNGPNSVNPAESDPYTLYQRIFGDSFRAPGEEGLVDPRLAWRRSVLDGVMEDIGSLQSELGAADKVRLDQHLQGVRDLEQRLARLEEDPPNLASCSRPGEPLTSYPDVDGRPQLSARSRAMADLAAMALACDQTRVLTFQFSQPLSGALYPDASDGHHSLTHNEGGDQPEVDGITDYIMQEFAYLLERFEAVVEGDGSLLDHSVVLATSEVSEGKTHSLDEIPMVIAGGGCGSLVMGQHLRVPGDNSNKAMLSILRSMDLSVSSFGTGDTAVSDGLSGLEL